MRYFRSTWCLLIGLALAAAPEARAEEMQYPPPPGGSWFAHQPHAPAAWESYFGYNSLWFSRGSFPTVTTGDSTLANPGILGSGNATVLAGNVRGDNPAPGFKAGVVFWLDDPESLSFEVDFFMNTQTSMSRSFASDDNGDPFLARTYFDADPSVNAQSASIRAFPGATVGSIFDSITTTVYGAEANFKWYSPSCYDTGSGLTCFVGGRWFYLLEKYQNLDTFTSITGAGIAATLSDTFSTSNQFYGPQVGVGAQVTFWSYTFSANGKVAVGPNQQAVNVAGSTSVTDLISGTTTNDNQGFYAQHSNSGYFHQTKVTVLPAADFKLQFNASRDCGFYAGYTVFMLRDTIRPTDQIDTNIIVQPIGSGTSTAPPNPPTFRQSNFIGQLVTLGMVLRF